MGATRNTGYLENLIQYDASDNVAIATSVNPSYKVTLGGSMLGTSAVFNGSITAGGNITINANGSQANNRLFTLSNGYMYLDGNTNGLILENNSTSSTRIRLEAADTMRFETTSLERLRITSAGDMYLTGRSTNGDYGMYFYSNDTDSRIYSSNSGAVSKSLIFYTSGNPRMTITSGGNIAINNTTAVSTSLVGALTIWKTYGADGASVPSPTAQNYYNNQDGLYLFGRNSGLSIISANGEEGTIHFANVSTIAYATIGATSGSSSVGGDMYFKVGSNVERMRISSGGAVTINQPTSGVSLLANGKASEWTGQFVGTSSTSVSYGVKISAGTNSSDRSLLIKNAADNTEFFVVYGDGSFSNPSHPTTANAANVYMTTGGTFFRSTSSLRYKKNIQDYAKGLQDVLKIRPVTFEGKSSADDGKVFAGFIAEEIHALGLSEYVVYTEEGNPESLHYGNMTAILVKAIQEQQAQIEELKSKLN